MAGRFWREAASLIIVGRAGSKTAKDYIKHNTDYNLLILKRSQKSQFMPSAVVFPGGVVDKSDFSNEWLEIFKKCGYTAKEIFQQIRNKAALPEFYANKSDSDLLPEIAMRITAIRETFEECGVLLASHQHTTLTPQQHQQWRTAVHEQAFKFLALFRELGGCPAIWDLHEWMGWLTPTNMGQRRFDTAFYITFMDNIPDAVMDGKEISGLQIASPYSIVQQWQQGELWLPPPQVYEIGRLLCFSHYNELQRFASNRGKEGLDRHLPVRINARDGVISVLPGDSLYPDTPDFTGTSEDMPHIDEAMEDARKRAKCLHRMEIKSLQHCRVSMNIKPKFGHVQPIDLMDLKVDSKL